MFNLASAAFVLLTLVGEKESPTNEVITSIL